MASRVGLALMCIGSLVTYVTCGYGHGGLLGGGNGIGGSGFGGSGFGGSLGGGHGGGWGQQNQVDHYAKPYYRYSYGVNDHYTGDNKRAYEHRDGENVEGQYALQEPDGSWRTVTYVADYNGFRANVHRTPSAHPHGGNSFGNGHHNG